jgi:hypothetical protein
MTCPVNMAVVAEEFVYTAKLCGMPESWLSKFTVTDAPAGTVIVLKLNAILCAIRSMVTLWAVVVGVVVGVGVGVDVDVGVGVALGVAVTVGVGVALGVAVTVGVGVEAGETVKVTDSTTGGLSGVWSLLTNST